MSPYKHTQVGYLIICVTLGVLAVFVWLYTTAAAEPPSVDSGTNAAISIIMTLIVGILASFTTLTVSVGERDLSIKFGYGLFRKRFALNEIVSVKPVKNHWYYGWGIHWWPRPAMWIYNVSGFDAVELVMKHGNIYRIGTNEPSALLSAITRAINE